MNFTNCKKLYFHCLASVALKPNIKVLKNHFHNMALKNLYVTPKLPTYFSIGHKIWICIIQWLCSLFPILIAIPFLGIFAPKNQNCRFILKFGTWTNSNMQNSMAMFNFSAFYWNYPFWANLFQLIKIAHLSWNFVSWLIQVRGI